MLQGTQESIAKVDFTNLPHPHSVQNWHHNTFTYPKVEGIASGTSA